MMVEFLKAGCYGNEPRERLFFDGVASTSSAGKDCVTG